MQQTPRHESTGTSGAMSARVIADRIGDHDAVSRRFAADRFVLVDELRTVTEAETGASWTAPDHLAWRDLRAEVAAVLSMHERSAQRLLDLARRLVHDFPATLAGLSSAKISQRNAEIVVEESTGLSPALWATYEARVLPAASELLAPRFARFAREVRAALEPEALIERHRDALLQRRVAVEAAPDGMAWFGALLSAEDAIGASAAVTGIARGLEGRG